MVQQDSYGAYELEKMSIQVLNQVHGPHNQTSQLSQGSVRTWRYPMTAGRNGHQRGAFLHKHGYYPSIAANMSFATAFKPRTQATSKHSTSHRRIFQIMVHKWLHSPDGCACNTLKAGVACVACLPVGTQRLCKLGWPSSSGAEVYSLLLFV